MIDSVLTNEELVFIYGVGCAACAATEPEVAAFERAHPRFTVLRVDAGGPYPERFGVKVRATPTFLFRRDGEGVVRVGAMKAREIEKWVKSLGAAL